MLSITYSAILVILNGSVQKMIIQFYVIIIIIISIFKEDNVFNMTANLPYGPPVNTDIGYYRTFLGLFCVSIAMLVVRYLLGEEKPILSL